MYGVLLLFFLLSHTESIRIGNIENNIMISQIQYSFVNISLHRCLCEMVTLNLSNVNYFQTNRTCQLLNGSINNTIYIEYYLNSSFIFVDGSLITAVSIRSTNTIEATTTSNINPTTNTQSTSSSSTTSSSTSSTTSTSSSSSTTSSSTTSTSTSSTTSSSSSTTSSSSTSTSSTSSTSTSTSSTSTSSSTTSSTSTSTSSSTSTTTSTSSSSTTRTTSTTARTTSTISTTTINPYACGNMTYLIGYDLPGSDITSSGLANYTLCCQWCRSYTGCVAYTWGILSTGWGAQTCFLKSSIPQQAANSAYVSAHN